MSQKLFNIRDGEKSFIIKSIFSLIVKIFGALSTFLFFLFFSNHLGANEFGVFAFLLSVANFGAIALTLGQPMFALKNMSMAMTGELSPEARGALRFSISTILFGAVVGFFAVLIFSLFSKYWEIQAPFAAYMAAAAMLVLLSLAEYLSHILRVFSSVSAALIPRDLIWRIAAPLICIALAAFSWENSVVISLWVNVAVLGTLVLWQSAHLFYKMPKDLTLGKADYSQSVAWRHSSYYFAGISLSTAFAQHLSIVAVGATFSAFEVGAFFAAFRTATLLSMPLTAASIVLGPVIARLYKERKIDELQRIIRQFLAIAALPTMLGFLILVFAGENILKLFSESYGYAHVALAIFGLSFMINTLCGPCAYIMMLTGGEATYFKYSIFANILGVLSSGFLARFGLIPAAVALAVFNIAQNLLAVRWCQKRVGLQTSIAIFFRAN